MSVNTNQFHLASHLIESEHTNTAGTKKQTWQVLNEVGRLRLKALGIPVEPGAAPAIPHWHFSSANNANRLLVDFSIQKQIDKVAPILKHT